MRKLLRMGAVLLALLVLSSLGQSSLSAQAKKTLELKELGFLTGHAKDVKSLAYSADSRTLASGSKDGVVKLWDVATRKEKATIKAHAGTVTAVAFSPDGKTLASGGEDKLIKLWDVASFKETNTLKGHAEAVNTVTFNKDGKLLASGDNKTLKLWDMDTAKEKSSQNSNRSIYKAVFSPDGKSLATCTPQSWSGGTVSLWTIPDLTGPIHLKETDSNGCFSIAYSSDGKTLAAAGDDGNAIVWDVASMKSKKLAGDSRTYFVGFLPDNKTLVTIHTNGDVRIRDSATGKPLKEYSHPLGFDDLTIALAPNGKTLVSPRSAKGESVRVWEAPTK